jgi:solute carrier family 13 (sodium-dependent dicarboxylate transporter), member 2/3/5
MTPDPDRDRPERSSDDASVDEDDVRSGVGRAGYYEDEVEAAAEELAKVRRVWAGRILGPLLAVILHQLLAGVDALPAEGRTTAAVGLLMAVWWMTEALPLPVTSLLPVVLFPLLRVTDVEAAAAPYANPVIFLFGGGFVIAQAVERWGLHRRIALRTVLVVGTEPRRLIGGFMLASGGLSMWISNSATTVMMLPIGVSVLVLLASKFDEEGSGTVGLPATWQPFATALMLSIAYAASIGSVATIIGTPPNGIMAGYLAAQGMPIGFGQWMLLGLPLASIFMVVAWLLLTRVLFTLDAQELPGGAQVIRSELADMGPMNRGERFTLGVFVTVASLWIARTWLQTLPGLGGLDDATIAIAGAVALFLIPVDRRRGVMVLDWRWAKRIPWSILVLFGGGLSLAAAIDASGLARFVGESVGDLDRLALPLLIVVITLTVVALTEVSSNTATAAVFLPILGGIAVGMGLGHAELVIPATLAATFAFMLPVATPPNAIVFGSGYIGIGQMVRAGVWLNLVGLVLNLLVVYTLASVVFGLDLW